jgi:hypothetical protein
MILWFRAFPDRRFASVVALMIIGTVRGNLVADAIPATHDLPSALEPGLSPVVSGMHIIVLHVSFLDTTKKIMAS